MSENRGADDLNGDSFGSTHSGKWIGFNKWAIFNARWEMSRLSKKNQLRQHENRSGYVWKKYLGATIFHEVQNLNGFETLSD